MAIHYIWAQGNAQQIGPNCDGIPAETCPKSVRIADEYQRGAFTLSSVLNFSPDTYDCGNQGWLNRKYSEIVEGDTLYTMLTVPHSSVYEVSVIAGATQARGARFASLVGISFRIVGDVFQSEGAELVTDPDTGTQSVSYNPDLDVCEPGDRLYESEIITITQETIEQRDKQSGSSMVLWDEGVGVSPLDNRWVGWGIVFESLPSDFSLDELTGYIAMMLSGRDYQHQLMS